MNLRTCSRIFLPLTFGSLLCGALVLPGMNLAPTVLAAESVRRISPQEAADLLQSPPAGLVILDVRTDKEFASGHLPGAVNLDIFRPDFAQQIGQMDRQKPYLVYCRTSSRSGSATELMHKAGFTNVFMLDQGFQGWTRNQLPVEK